MGMSIKEIQVGVEYKVRGTIYSGVKFESLNRYSKDKRISARYTGEYRLDEKGMYFKTTRGRFVHITQVEDLYSSFARRYFGEVVEAPAAEVVEAPAAKVEVIETSIAPIKLKVTEGMTKAQRDEWWMAAARDYIRQARAEWDK